MVWGFCCGGDLHTSLVILAILFVGNLATLGVISYRSEDLCGHRERGGLLGTRVKGVI
jgi:hypothetical protein